MDLLYPVLRTVLICLVGFGIAYQGRRKGYTIFNLSGRFNVDYRIPILGITWSTRAK